MAEHSDGSTASYYELPEGAKELQDLISYRNMNAQIGEIFRACYRYGQAAHSDQLRDAKKMRFYAQAEIERLEKYESLDLPDVSLDYFEEMLAREQAMKELSQMDADDIMAELRERKI